MLKEFKNTDNNWQYTAAYTDILITDTKERCIDYIAKYILRLHFNTKFN